MHTSQRQIFLNHVGQTSDFPMLLEIEKASGIYLTDIYGKKYVDLVSGVSVSNLGHSHPAVVEAVIQQAQNYMHLMVYGEYVQNPQTQFAKLLTSLLPDTLNSVYFVNSGSEATEGAMKLAKRYTGRTQMICMRNAYHGSTHGALSVCGNEDFKNSFRPLLPDIQIIDFNNLAHLQNITTKTACVIAECLQAEGGAILPQNDYLIKLKQRCVETGALLIIDEIQTGFGRSGSLFAFEQFGFVPDILLIAKAMGGGMPIGAFVADKKIMDVFKTNPILGHITTFGGHPVSAAAAYASLKYLVDNDVVKDVNRKGGLFRKNLENHPKILEIRGMGLFYAVELGSFDRVQQFIKNLIQNGAVTDWFLFHDTAFRIAPPLIITEDEIIQTCEIITKSLDF